MISTNSELRAAVQAAVERLRGGVVRTPTDRSRTLSQLIDGDVFLKLETRQVTGSFKERGALNALSLLSDEQRRRGVVTMSAGNHAQGVAYHAARLGIAATVVMPEGTPFLKIRRTQDYGAKVELHGATFEQSSAYVHDLVERTGVTLIHPYDDANVIAGQATATLELLEDAGTDLDAIVVPVGGGGLISGAVLAAEVFGSKAEVIGVESQFYPALYAEMRGEATIVGGMTIAEGIAVEKVGRLPLSIVRDAVRDVLLVSEPAIEGAIAYLLEDEKLVAEGAGAAGVAAVRSNVERFRGKRVGTLLCGGNIDLGMLASVIVRARMRAGRVVQIRVLMVDKPGGLVAIASAVNDANANVLDVLHHRLFGSVPAKYAQLDLTCELQRPEDIEQILANIAARGYEAEVITG
ncbi:MAG TPA: threonine ammonia-lyase [Candidatus Lustribacter sp.]|nr:threonine ammonia-lyase [Candidatus Lustribacter sp.]